MRRSIAPYLATAAFVASPQVLAAEEEWDGGYDEKAEVRSDFAAGLGLGLASGRSVGYPNQAGRIGNPDYEADTGFAMGDDYELWIGGALRDWFTFGLGVTGGGLVGNGLVAWNGGFLIHIETYPLFYQGSFGRDFGVYGNFGLGSTTIDDEESSDRMADGGAMSIVGIGAVYELWHFGYFAAGPTLEYRHLFSESLKQHYGIAGMRIVFYSRP